MFSLEPNIAKNVECHKLALRESSFLLVDIIIIMLLVKLCFCWICRIVCAVIVLQVRGWAGMICKCITFEIQQRRLLGYFLGPALTQAGPDVECLVLPISRTLVCI